MEQRVEIITTATLSATLAVCLATGCRPTETPPPATVADEFPSALVDFVPSEGNPVFTAADPGSWDSGIRERGWILRDETGYRMWYTGFDGDGGEDDLLRLGYATSPDGLAWTRHDGNPLVDDLWIEDMMVVRHEGRYLMFAEGVGDRAHWLESADGLSWTPHGRLDVRTTDGEPLSDGPYGTPTVWVEGDTWYFFYERNDAGIWLATSKDRTTWTNVQDEPVIAAGPEAYDRHAVALNQIVKHQGRYYAYYHASAHQPWRDWTTNVAVSDDLIDWKKYPGNPILEENKSSGILVHDGQKYRLYTMHDRVDVHFPATPDASRE